MLGSLSRYYIYCYLLTTFRLIEHLPGFNIWLLTLRYGIRPRYKDYYQISIFERCPAYVKTMRSWYLFIYFVYRVRFSSTYGYFKPKDKHWLSDNRCKPRCENWQNVPLLLDSREDWWQFSIKCVLRFWKWILTFLMQKCP